MGETLKGADGRRAIQLGLSSKELCTADPKCIRKDGHDGECWPKTGPR